MSASAWRMSSIDSGEPQWPHDDVAARSMGAPQFEQFTVCTWARSSATCCADNVRTKSFSRRKSKKVMKRPCPRGQRP